MIRRLCALLCAVIGAALALPSAASAYTPHVLTYTDNLDVATLNPFLATSGNIANLSELTMAVFTRYDAQGRQIPELITELPTRANHGISPDGKAITWHLRHGVKWSDGAPFDAGDVVYTVAVAKDNANNLSARDPWDRLTSVSAPDKYTVVFHFNDPYSAFLSDYFAANTSLSCVLPKHILGPGTAINNAAYNGLPVGIGAFRYTAFRRGDAVEMEANPYYWRGQPKLKKIIYKIQPEQNTSLTQLQTGEIDMWDTVNGTYADRAKAIPNKANFTRLSQFMGGLFFNTSHPQLSDPRVRRALRLATNRQTIFDKVVLRNGTMTESVVPRIAKDFADIPFSAYNPAAAEKLLDDAGWKRASGGTRAKNGVPLSLDIAIPAGYAPSETMAALIHDDWGAIGVGLVVHTYANGTFFGPYSAGGILETGKFDVATLSQGGGNDSNVASAYACSSVPPKGFNLTRYCRADVDASVAAYLHTFDPAAKAKIAKTVQEQIDTDAPIIVLYERGFLAVYDNRLTGYHPGGFTTFGDPLDLDI